MFKNSSILIFGFFLGLFFNATPCFAQTKKIHKSKTDQYLFVEAGFFISKFESVPFRTPDESEYTPYIKSPYVFGLRKSNINFTLIDQKKENFTLKEYSISAMYGNTKKDHYFSIEINGEIDSIPIAGWKHRLYKSQLSYINGKCVLQKNRTYLFANVVGHFHGENIRRIPLAPINNSFPVEELRLGISIGPGLTLFHSIKDRLTLRLGTHLNFLELNYLRSNKDNASLNSRQQITNSSEWVAKPNHLILTLGIPLWKKTSSSGKRKRRR